MNPRQASLPQLDEWMVRLIRPVHAEELDPEERFSYNHFLYRVRNLVIIKAMINALMAVLFLFTVMPDSPGTVLMAIADGLLLIPYYFLARRWPALSTIGMLSLTAVAVSAADALSGYQTFTSGVFYAILIVAGAVLLLHPRNIAIITFLVTLIFVATYLLEMTHVIPVQMTLLTPRAVLRVMALHALSFMGLGAASGVLAQLYRQLLLTRSQRDIQLALQEGFHDITANVDLHTMLQRIAERAVSTLPNVDRAFLVVQEGEKLVVRGAAGSAPLNPIGIKFPMDLLDYLPADNPTTMTTVLENFRKFIPPDLLTEWPTLPLGQAIFFYPLHTQEDRHVLLVVSNTRSDEAFDEKARRILDLFAHQAAIAIDNAQLLATAQESLHSEIALSRIGQEIASHLRMPELIPAIHQHLSQVINTSAFLIAVKSSPGDALQLLSPIDGEKVQSNRMISTQGILGWVMRNRRTLRFGDMHREVATYPDIQILTRGPIHNSLLAVPLLIGDQVIGVLSVQSPQTHIYDQRDEDLLTNLANYIAVAVQNARLYDEVQQNQDELQGLIAAVSQQLQGPAEALLGFGHLLRESLTSSLTEEQDEYLERLERNSYWISQLVEDMLFLSRLDQVQEETEPITLGTLVRGVATHLELEEQGIKVTIEPDMPTLYADPVLLWAYFRNVLQNACRLFPGITDPQINIECTLTAEGYQLSVQANSQALTPEQLPQAYELFFPIGGQENMGIGLAIARRIGEHYGGSVWAATDRGTTFNLILPTELGIDREDRQ